MSDESDDLPDGGRTVFIPSGTAGPKATPQDDAIAAAAPSSEPEAAADPESPVEAEWPPLPEAVAAAEPEVEAQPPPARAMQMTTGPTAAEQGAKVAARGSGRVEVGSVLNHIYQVTRFIARGGMGEVFEGANVNSDERVAIKVMLPQLAADPTVQEMFRKEARTLTRLSHPAVVQYRLLAQEPDLGVLYIVTEFIDGKSLADVMRGLNATEKDLRTLLRRLAEGLRAAHELGAVHRDMSPDNVLLPDDRIDRAKIIDFGIAKDLDPSKATIVGDGFAGKLGYVAPEQFGDFDRQIGPWTDVYSLGLVVLAAAIGRDVDMGATLVEAIDKRRSGPDLASIPPGLRPVLQRMLMADPAQRLRSMDEVIAALETPAGAAQTAAPAPAAPKTVWAPKAKASGRPTKAPDAAKTASAPARKLPLPLVLGGGAAAALILVGVVVFLAMPKKPPAQAAGATASSTSAPKAEVARRAVEAALNNVSCSWLDLTSATDQGSGVAIKLAGVAGSPSAAQNAVIQAAGAVKVPVADVNVDQDVAPAAPAVCAPLDGFRSVRAGEGSAQSMVADQRSFAMSKQPDGSIQGFAVIEMHVGDPSTDFALYGVQPDGFVGPIITSRKDFEAKRADPHWGSRMADLGNDSYRVTLEMTPPAGLYGMLLLTGRGPFSPDIVAPAPNKRSADWPQQFRQAATAAGWKASMAWFRMTPPAGG
jgi:serine/threonine-protein kinase